MVVPDNSSLPQALQPTPRRTVWVLLTSTLISYSAHSLQLTALSSLLRKALSCGSRLPGNPFDTRGGLKYLTGSPSAVNSFLTPQLLHPHIHDRVRLLTRGV